jgi:hypothetical protein
MTTPLPPEVVWPVYYNFAQYMIFNFIPVPSTTLSRSNKDGMPDIRDGHYREQLQETMMRLNGNLFA